MGTNHSNGRILTQRVSACPTACATPGEQEILQDVPIHAEGRAKAGSMRPSTHATVSQDPDPFMLRVTAVAPGILQLAF